MLDPKSKGLIATFAIIIIACLVGAVLLLTISGEQKRDTPAEENEITADILADEEEAPVEEVQDDKLDDIEPIVVVETEPQFTDDGRRLFEGRYDSFLYQEKASIEATSACVEDRTQASLETIFNPAQATAVLDALTQNTVSGVTHICNNRDGTGLLVMNTGSNNYQYAMLSEQIEDDTWSLEEGGYLSGNEDEVLSVYAGYNALGGGSPLLWWEDAYLGDVNAWRIFEVDSFFGNSRPVENCEITAVNGEMYTACEIFN